MGLDRADPHEQLCGDLLVGPTVGCHGGDLELSLSEVRCRAPAADPAQFPVRLLGPQRRSELLEDRVRPLERVPCRLLLSSLPADGPKAQQRSCPLQWVMM